MRKFTPQHKQENTPPFSNREPLCDRLPYKLPSKFYFRHAIAISTKEEVVQVVDALVKDKGTPELNRITDIMKQSPGSEAAFRSMVSYIMKNNLSQGTAALLYHVVENFASAIEACRDGDATDYEKKLAEKFSESDLHSLKGWALKLYPLARVFISDPDPFVK